MTLSLFVRIAPEMREVNDFHYSELMKRARKLPRKQKKKVARHIKIWYNAIS
jgi:hypothetical protein